MEPALLAASSTCSTIGFPPAQWSTFGNLDFMRVPLPAAKIMVINPSDFTLKFTFLYCICDVFLSHFIYNYKIETS